MHIHRHLWDGALLYFSNKQWNFGRFLSHLDSLPHFPRDKKFRHELGTELWVALLSDFAGNDSNQGNKCKATKELARIRKPSKTVTNNVVNASTINGLVNGAKRVDVCNIGDSKTPSLGNPNSQVPPPPYDKSPLQDPTASRSNTINKPTIAPSSYADHPTNEISEVEQCSPVNHFYRNGIKGVRKPSTDIAPSSPTSPGVGGLGGVDLSGYDIGFPESPGDESMDVIAAVDFGGTCAGSSVNFTPGLHPNDEPVELGGVTESTMGEDVAAMVNIRSNTPSNSWPLFLDERHTPSSDRLREAFLTRGSSPAGRLPSFSGFDAIPSDCVGCCLHPPTQQLPSQCHSRAASPASSAPGAGIARIQSARAHVSLMEVHASSGLNTPTNDREKVKSQSVSSTALKVTPSENLKRASTGDKAHIAYQKLLEIQSHNLNMQSHNLKMQMALNQMLVDELATWTSSSPKRQRL
ncbi:hypothetical protein EV426DRAFT_712711 [Tirmania nivea]|nr:hypothetical protein EV426DRAFT_712711 [Tirmania nivea]